MRFQDNVRTVSNIEHQSISQNQQVEEGSDAAIFPYSPSSPTTTHLMSHHFYHQPRSDSRVFGRRRIKMGWQIFSEFKSESKFVVNFFKLNLQINYILKKLQIYLNVVNKRNSYLTGR